MLYLLFVACIFTTLGQEIWEVRSTIDPRFQTPDNTLPKYVPRMSEDTTTMFSYDPVLDYKLPETDPCCNEYEHDCPRDHKWQCDSTVEPIICGHSCNENWKCLCDMDIDNVQQCYQLDFCYNRPYCTSSTECMSDEVCIQSCCPGGPRCFKECEVPTPVPTPQPTYITYPPPTPYNGNQCPCSVKSTSPWQCNWPAEECGIGDPTNWWNCYCLPQVSANEWKPNDPYSNACIENNWCSAAPNCNVDNDCPIGYECIPHTCCTDHRSKCAKCCDHNEPEPTPKPTPEPTPKPTRRTRSPTSRTRSPTRPTKSPVSTCPCVDTEPFMCIGGFDWPDQARCGVWTDEATGLTHLCSCTKPHELAPIKEETVCIREWEEEGCSDYIKYPYCDSNFECPPGYYCLQEDCCDPDERPRCAPCCDQPWNEEPWPLN